MSKYIDAEKLIAEIEKRAKFHDDAMKACMGLDNIAITHSAGWKEDTELLSIINSLQQEQPEVNLDNHTIMEEIRKCGCNPNEFDIAKHFFELGLKARKEE